MPLLTSRGPTDEQFAELVHASWPSLYRTAVLLVRDHALAEDLVQTALAKTYSNWSGIRDVGAARGYARRALVTTATSWFRRRSFHGERPTAELPEPVTDHDPRGATGDRIDLLAVLAQLPPRQRAVVVLRFYDDLSVDDTAELLGISAGTVKSQTSAALAGLRRLLDADVDVSVPHPDAPAIAAQGRARRTRRRVAAVAAAVTAVVLLAAGGIVVRGLGDDSRESQVTGREATDVYQEYAGWGAWATGRELTIGATTVTLDGPPQPLVQTSMGVVARQVDDSGAVHFSLIGPEGIERKLSIPASAPTIDGDPNGTRVAWLETGTDLGTVHVWDVVDDREVGTATVPLPGSTPEGGRTVLQPVVLERAYVYVRTDQGTTHRVEWATGDTVDLPYRVASSRTGITVTADDTGTWQVIDSASGTVIRTLGRRLESVTVSPDGRSLLVVEDGADGPEAHVEPYDSDERTALPGIGPISTWTTDGHVIGQPDGERALRRCSIGGDCEDRDVPGLDDESPLLLVADYLMVG
ncbi:SigE family RNA polymerase sigma factor [Nocardioides humi]|uniref:RNA polymerase sigma-70 factor, sigma-E family n=1 Tax=Nocardioides humi TaxID=449461 RepID=A0ABN1ZYX0_9ACTN|nr:SigE family RNA polymerase sigma factor [Nocardioides humi]